MTSFFEKIEVQSLLREKKKSDPIASRPTETGRPERVGEGEAFSSFVVPRGVNVRFEVSVTTGVSLV